jgi:hypothetical protein
MIISFVSDSEYRGTGVSSGLERGLLVFHNNRNITSEGMGIGAAAIKKGGVTYFARPISRERVAPDRLRSTVSFSMKSEWRIFGIRSRCIEIFVELLAKLYMRFLPLQKSFLRIRFAELSRKAFNVEHRIVRTRSRGTATFEYRLSKDTAIVNLKIESKNIGKKKICIMNEASADFFDSSLINGKIAGPPWGWEPVRGEAGFLYSREKRVSFCIKNIRLIQGDACSIRLYKGWENTKELCWTGFDIEILPLSRKIQTIEIEYEACFKEVNTDE